MKAVRSQSKQAKTQVITTTKNAVYRRFSEFEGWRKEGSFFFEKFQSDIQKFYTNSKGVIDEIFDRMKQIDCDHYEHTMGDDGMPAFTKDENGQAKLKEGKTVELHTDAYREMLKEECQIKI